MPLSQEGTTIERVELAPERTEPDRTIVLVSESEATLAISIPETTPPSTPMPIPATASATQDILATPTTAHTLLLLTYGP